MKNSNMPADNQLHLWCVTMICQFKGFRQHMEFKVESRNILGATMKASKTLKAFNEKEEENVWKIKSIKWLDFATEQGAQ